MECGSPGGFRIASSAGSTVMLLMKAMIMPEPAICPSSERPRYAVGRNEEKPTAVAAAASASGPPTFTAVLCRASGRSS